MNNKILSITEKVPQPAKIPSGTYTGLWSGNHIEVKANHRLYDLETEESVKGLDIKVMIMIKDEGASFEILNN